MIEPGGITAGHVREWLGQDANRLKDTSLHARARGMRTFLRFLASEYSTPKVEFAMPRLERRRLPCMEPDEVRRLLAVCDVRERVVVMMLVDAGIRRAELAALNWGDVDLRTGQVTVRHGKGGKDRVTAVVAQTLRALLRYRLGLKRDPAADTPLILGMADRRLTPHHLSRLVAALGRKAGVKVTPHALRRTFALQALRKGMDVMSLMRLMGHADIAMTSHYVQLLDSDVLSAHQKAGLDSWL